MNSSNCLTAAQKTKVAIIYQDADGKIVCRYSESALLVTHLPPPDSMHQVFSEVHSLKAEDWSTHKSASSAAKMIKKHFAKMDIEIPGG